MSTKPVLSPTPAATPGLPYALVDVFAEAPLEGNMLAIFPDARGLTDEQMQALAREMNLSETTFILPAADPEQERREGVRVRIFTTEEELPFAGHPSLGTASWLYLHHLGLAGSESITLDLAGGKVPVRFGAQSDSERGVFATMQQRNPEFGIKHERSAVAEVTGLRAEDIDERYPVQTVSTGLPFCIVYLRSLEALRGLEIPQVAAQAYLRARGAQFFYVLARSADSPDTFDARMQFYHGEDPATGSAAGCAVSWLVRYGLVPSNTRIELRQGADIARPSHIFAQATLTRDEIDSVFVSGRTIPVASGRFS